ncbi:MAG: hypothetical protein M3275_04395 [Thermoproteota archaeon]|nr:hypothetical protein [Thermoproteota archaeon]
MPRQGTNQEHLLLRSKRCAAAVQQQQQYSPSAQLGHSPCEGLALHSEGRQPQSAHLICIPGETHMIGIKKGFFSEEHKK